MHSAPATSAAPPSTRRGRELTAAEAHALRRRRGRDIALCVAWLSAAALTALFVVLHPPAGAPAYGDGHGCNKRLRQPAPLPDVDVIGPCVDGPLPRCRSCDPNPFRCRREDRLGGAQVEVGMLGVDGALNRSIVALMLARSRHEAGRCYSSQLARSDNQSEGKVVIELTVGAGGRVQSAIFAQSTMRGPALGALKRCVRGVVERVTFPSSTGETRIAYPLSFRPAPR